MEQKEQIQVNQEVQKKDKRVDVWNNNEVILKAQYTMIPHGMDGFFKRLSDAKIMSLDISAVLRTLLEHKFDERNPFPGQELLAKKLGVSVSSIEKAIRYLVAGGFLIKVKKPKGERGLAYDIQPFIDKFAAFLIKCKENDYKVDVYTLFTQEELDAMNELKEKKRKHKGKQVEHIETKPVQPKKATPAQPEQPAAPITPEQEERKEEPQAPQAPAARTFDEVFEEVFADYRIYPPARALLRDYNITDVETLRFVKRRYQKYVRDGILLPTTFVDKLEAALSDATHFKAYLNTCLEQAYEEELELIANAQEKVDTEEEEQQDPQSGALARELAREKRGEYIEEFDEFGVITYGKVATTLEETLPDATINDSNENDYAFPNFDSVFNKGFGHAMKKGGGYLE